MIVSVLLSWAVARTVTRPLSALTATMREIAATGDLARPVAMPQPVGRRGRDVAGARSRHAHRLDRPLPEGGRPARPALRARPAVDGDRPRDPQPVDDHQGLPAHAEARGSAGGGGARGGRRHRAGGGAAQPSGDRRAGLRAAAEARAVRGRARGAGRAGAARRARRPRRDEPAGSPWTRGPAVIVTDGERLRTVLVNLVENARDSVAAAPAGGGRRRSRGRETSAAAPAPPVDIEVGACRLDSGLVRFWVQDAGAGIPKRTWRTSSSRTSRPSARARGWAWRSCAR